jgi:hypothetical protein
VHRCGLWNDCRTDWNDSSSVCFHIGNIVCCNYLLRMVLQKSPLRAIAEFFFQFAFVAASPRHRRWFCEAWRTSDIYVAGISYLLPSESNKLLEALKQRQERRSSFASPGRAAVSDLSSPSVGLGHLDLSGTDNGTLSPLVPQRNPVAVPEQHQSFIANILWVQNIFLHTFKPCWMRRRSLVC